jgi:cholesterol transport system auxiliary component
MHQRESFQIGWSNTMKTRATYAIFIRARCLIVLLFAGLTGCALPRPSSAPAVFDFGPGILQTQPSTRLANLPPLELASVKASTALSGTAVLYRLGYADAQQLKPYTLARWSMPPAQLIEQRVRAHLGQRRAVMSPGEITLAPSKQPSAPASDLAGAAQADQPQTLLGLHLAVEEFSQIFESAEKSSGVLRLRVTATQRSAAGETLLAQRNFTAQRAAPTPDASGGVLALTGVADQVVKDIEVWLGQVEQAGKSL